MARLRTKDNIPEEPSESGTDDDFARAMGTWC